MHEAIVFTNFIGIVINIDDKPPFNCGSTPILYDFEVGLTLVN